MQGYAMEYIYFEFIIQVIPYHTIYIYIHEFMNHTIHIYFILFGMIQVISVISQS